MDYKLMEMKTIAKQLNNRVFTDYFYRLMLLARSVFEWSGLEELGLDERWIERYLFTEGKCVFFKDKIKGFMVARVTPNGKLNAFDDPTKVRPYSTGYMGKDLVPDVDCVLIRNNDCMIPTSPTIQLYAMKLADIDRTISVNIHAQKSPVIVKCNEKQMLTLKNAMKQRADNEPVIWVDKSTDFDGVEVLDLKAPLVFKDLELQKHMVYNECMTFLGVNNANMDKRERLVDDEVQANNEQVEANFNMMLKARERACKKINEIFGTNISVKRRISNKLVLDDSEGSEGMEEGVI